DRPSLVDGFHAPHHTFGRFHGNTTHPSFAQVLLHFQNHVDRVGHGEAVADHFERLVNRRHGALDKLHIDGRAGNLNYASNSLWHRTSASSCEPLAASLIPKLPATTPRPTTVGNWLEARS